MSKDFYPEAKMFAEQATKAREQVRNVIKENVENWACSPDFRGRCEDAARQGENRFELSEGIIEELFCVKGDFPHGYNSALENIDRAYIRTTYIGNILKDLIAEYGYYVSVARKNNTIKLIITFKEVENNTFTKKTSSKEECECNKTNIILVGGGETENDDDVAFYLQFDADNNQLDIVVQVDEYTEGGKGTSVIKDSVAINYCPFCGRKLSVSEN